MSRKKILISEINLKKIGGRIAYIRLKNNLSQRDFAKTSEISIGNLSGLENHKYEPSYHAIIKILEAFNVNSNWLLTGEGEMTRGKNNASIYKVETPDEDPEIKDLLISALEVLNSDTNYSESLSSAIRAAHNAVKTEKRLNGLEKRIEKMEKDKRSRPGKCCVPEGNLQDRAEDVESDTGT